MKINEIDGDIDDDIDIDGRFIVRLWQMQELRLRTWKLQTIFNVKYAICNMNTQPSSHVDEPGTKISQR